LCHFILIAMRKILTFSSLLYFIVFISCNNRNDITQDETNTDSIFKLNWIKSTDFPGTARYNPLSFSFNGKGYLGLGYNSIEPTKTGLKDMWVFDSDRMEWIRKGDCPFSIVITTLSSGCLVDSMVYIYSNNSLYSYSPNVDRWDSICILPIQFVCMSCFSIDHKVYFFDQSNSDLYEYIPNQNIFNKKSALIRNFLDWGLAESFVFNNEAFLIYKNKTKVEIYHYLSLSDSWERKLEKEFSNAEFHDASFIITVNNSAFIGQSTEYTVSSLSDTAIVYPNSPISNVWRYDMLKNELKKATNLPGEYRSRTGHFLIGNTGYVIAGQTIDSITHNFKYLNELWTFF
jgi:hypothetical protein